MTLRLILLLALVSAPAFAGPFPKAPHVYVEGSAEIRVEPDTLDLSVVIEKIDPKLEVAKASVDERARKLISACKELGIASEDITSPTLLIGPWYDYRREERKFLGTRVHREIGITLRDLGRYSELLQAIVAADVNEAGSATMSATKEAKVLEQAQQMALADARARAERLAAASDQEVGAAYSISEFNLRSNERYVLRPAREIETARERRASRIVADTGVASSPPEPFEPGTLTATATVYVIYLLE